ncbi:MAG TPA: hypothetical protein VE078_19360 [Thermoanaerobaculia bacterium]|nr:hypothetical protein [Thermoanaerobaculia bacterium]
MALRTQSLIVLAGAALLMTADVPDAFGQEQVSAKGKFTFSASSESVSLPGGRTLQRAVSNGIILTDDPSSPLNESATTCIGATVVSASGEPVAGSGHCEAIDKDGDVWMLWWRNDAHGGPWGYINGTGKFEGIEGGGTWAEGPQWPDGRGINTWETTYTLK